MNKILLALFVCVISLNVFACGDHDDDNKDERFEVVTTIQK